MTLAQDFYDDRDWTEDGRLAQAHLSGDPTAFPALYRRYRPDLVAYLDHRVRDHGLAEDLAQETMERALRFLGTFDPTRPLWPWLRTIASRIATTETTRRAAEVTGLDVTTTDTTVVDATEAFVSRAAVEDCLERIPLRQRRALVARYVEDRDPSDIAAQFGLNRTAFEQLMWRARRNLAREYRARNAAPWLPLWPSIQRLRRFVLDVTSRFGTVAGTGLSFASDMAFGAAITGIGLGIATGVVGGPAVANAEPPSFSGAPVIGHLDQDEALEYVATRSRAVSAGVMASDVTRSADGTVAAATPPGAGATSAADPVVDPVATADDAKPGVRMVTTPHEPVPTAEPQHYKTTEIPKTVTVPATGTSVTASPAPASGEGGWTGSEVIVNSPVLTVDCAPTQLACT
jgi:RNA polymerase sigma-70 factor (ECF subfamily)